MPDVDAAVRRGHPILFGLLAVIGIIEGAITSWLVRQYQHGDNTYPNNSFRDRLRFAVFTSWWTVIFSIAFMVLYLMGIGGIFTSIASHTIWLFVTWVFWLAVAASITSMLGGGYVCSHSDLVYCNQNVAAEAFAWIEWIIITVIFIMTILLGYRAMRGGGSATDRIGA
ncbi:hypothetical protein QFC24_001429 [Naganishia onofrii]|uniref:Uncharacterized protein n=1 Tax=Naganishia onofrii TaxID=1851511 RepID=A0ACC2XT99_9TREE|nr:hypothetical protein QFC24_001429 [Naganishia onofrii]